MVCARDTNTIVNIDSFSRDIADRFKRDFPPQRILADTPMKHNISITASDINSLICEVMKLAKELPHQSCAVTYKINDNSSINLEIHPVIDAA